MNENKQYDEKDQRKRQEKRESLHGLRHKAENLLAQVMKIARRPNEIKQQNENTK